MVSDYVVLKKESSELNVVNSYSEAIDVLYAANRSEFRNIDNFKSFSMTILPHRINTIRDLCISHLFPTYMFITTSRPLPIEGIDKIYPPAPEWVRARTIMSGMKSLQMLWIDLYSQRDSFVSPKQEEAILAPLNTINSPAKFVVKVAWAVCDGEAESAARPFKLLRAWYSDDRRAGEIGDPTY